MTDLRERLIISEQSLKEINQFILDPENELINPILELIEKYGGPEEIDRKANEARKLEDLLVRLKEEESPYLGDLHWLTLQWDSGAFIKLEDYGKKVLDDASKGMSLNDKNAVTLEISALNFFPWLIPQAKMAIEKQ